MLDYRLRLRGIPLRWKSEIAVWQPPHRVVDRQTKGPYSIWVHEHTFAEQDGGTIVGDNVEYAGARRQARAEIFCRARSRTDFSIPSSSARRAFRCRTAVSSAMKTARTRQAAALNRRDALDVGFQIDFREVFSYDI
jgi:ligand-binding SRPBCC domain-containing protein